MTEYNPARAENQVARLTSHMRENVDFVAIIRSLGGAKWQVLEDVVRDLLTRRFLGDAENAQLDVIGKHLITARQGLDDPEYTILLDSRFNFFQRSGEPERLIELFQTLTGSILIRYDDTYKLQCNSLTAYFTPEQAPDIPGLDKDKIIADMRVAKQAGQGLRLLFVITPAFKCSDIPDEPTLGSDNGLDNGFLGTVIIEF